MCNDTSADRYQRLFEQDHEGMSGIIIYNAWYMKVVVKISTTDINTPGTSSGTFYIDNNGTLYVCDSYQYPILTIDTSKEQLMC